MFCKQDQNKPFSADTSFRWIHTSRSRRRTPPCTLPRRVRVPCTQTLQIPKTSPLSALSWPPPPFRRRIASTDHAASRKNDTELYWCLDWLWQYGSNKCNKQIDLIWIGLFSNVSAVVKKLFEYYHIALIRLCDDPYWLCPWLVIIDFHNLHNFIVVKSSVYHLRDLQKYR